MSLLKAGNRALEIRIAESAPRCLRRFVARLADTELPTIPTGQVMQVRGGHQTRLTVDVDRGEVLLELATDLAGDPAALEIGVLQAAARSVAVMKDVELALLHGSAVTADGGRSAIAVLDGGRGQGKTSLALGVAARGGSLLVDEFAFTVFPGGQPCVVPMPTLPWHVRADMAPLLAPHATERLLYPVDLPAPTTDGNRPLPLNLIVIPDHGLAPGELREAPALAARDLLRAAVNDHEAKLRDPTLDHVSIFSSADDVTISSSLPAFNSGEKALDALAAVPVIRVGIGNPDDLPASVTAVIRRIRGAS
ncbi:hypothetical protein GA0074696_0267 [Micromonospora purpureochromogenes]|uniref:Hpr(Ser) kinase/phosphatase n=1 Tax=Micromonospora purpureochromogenes TaxID=47872 RepID=A0A1C4UC59_9ACTN|nr:hypothetical protein [Micromonospora purpureochromogenes]SCE69285.1 hypothetical protein GA0074696_0267 [Micromonospora purpureochromogenes]